MTQNETLTVRPLVLADKLQWAMLWDGYLAFYQHPLADEVTSNTFARLCANQEMVGLVAEDADGQLLGLMHLLFHPSTWSIAGYCYIEDLFVSETARGQGVARKLFAHAYALADLRGSDRVYWATHDTNSTAKALYDSLGERTGFLTYRRW